MPTTGRYLLEFPDCLPKVGETKTMETTWLQVVLQEGWKPHETAQASMLCVAMPAATAMQANGLQWMIAVIARKPVAGANGEVRVRNSWALFSPKAVMTRGSSQIRASSLTLNRNVSGRDRNRLDVTVTTDQVEDHITQHKRVAN